MRSIFRVGGVWLGTVTLLCDTGKGLAIVLLGNAVLPPPSQWSLALAAFLVLFGHAYSAWFYLTERRFSEGKSVASALGITIAFTCLGEWPWQAVAVPGGVWAVGLLGPRLLTGRWQSISPATMTSIVSFPVTMWATRADTPYTAFSIALAVLILIRHKNNIKRLLAGTETRPERAVARDPVDDVEAGDS